MKRQHPFSAAGGFALVSAIFLLVILTSLGAFLVSIVSTQNITSAQDVVGARAYHAARAGIEWSLYAVLDPANTTVVAPAAAAWPNMPACPAAGTVMLIEGFTVTVDCASFPTGVIGATGPPVYWEADTTRAIIVYQLTATAQSTGVAVGAPGYVERQVAVTVSKCRASDMVASPYECP